MNIKPYPQPSKKFSTRFAYALDEEGNELLRPAVLPPNDRHFEYDTDKKEPSFPKAKLSNSTKKDIINPYIPGEELKALIRLMQIIQRPVLLKGEPGSGKTQLAKAVAYEWYGPKYREHYFEWHIKSSAKAVDGLYSIDHLKRLRDAQLAGLKAKGSLLSTANVEKISDYRSFGPLGQAILLSTAENPAIVLIDEIDKADIDFPNDLLLELDQMRFYIPETLEHFQAAHPPMIFITSNDERELPEAFLRRCLFMYTQFPSEKDLRNILKAHIPGLFDLQTAIVDSAKAVATSSETSVGKVEPNLDIVSGAIARFHKLREDIKNDPADNKRVSTSELIDWMKAYYYELKEGNLVSQKMQLEKLEHLPLYFQTLLKTYRAYQREIREKKH